MTGDLGTAEGIIEFENFEWIEEKANVTITKNKEDNLRIQYRVLDKELNVIKDYIEITSGSKITGLNNGETVEVRLWDGINGSSTASFTVVAYNISITSVTGGTMVANMGTAPSGQEVTITPTASVGYTYNGAIVNYADGSINLDAGTKTFTMPVGDVTIAPKWTANSGITYTVNHYTQNLNSTEYSLNTTENLTGITASEVTPSLKTITGFTAPSTQKVTIKGDGSTVVNYYYSRNSYTFTLGSGTGVSTSGSTATGSYEYGATITLKATANAGYTWSKWTSSNTNLVANNTTANTTIKMPAGDITMTPSATVNTNTKYTVKHYTENLNSTEYSLNSTENLTGTTASEVTPAVKTITGFTAPSTQKVTIKGDGSTVVNYYYSRNSYTFTLGSGTGVSTSGSTTTGSYEYGATITLKATANAGYKWSKWTSSNTNLVANNTTANTTIKMPAGNITMTPSATLITYTITYNLNSGTQGSNAKTSYNVTTATFSLPTPTRANYNFKGWYTNSSFSGSAVTQIAKGSTGNKTYYAKWESARLYLINQGDNTSVTGGWKASDAIDTSGGDPVKPSISLSGGLTMKQQPIGGNSIGTVHTVKKINLTKYKKLYLKMSSSSGLSYCTVYLTSTTTSLSPCYASLAMGGNVKTHSIDVSGINTSCYLIFWLRAGVGNPDNVKKFTQIWLE